jgi:hypothetical protein
MEVPVLKATCSMIKTATASMTLEDFVEMPDPVDGTKQELVAGELLIRS